MGESFKFREKGFKLRVEKRILYFFYDKRIIVLLVEIFLIIEFEFIKEKLFEFFRN